VSWNDDQDNIDRGRVMTLWRITTAPH